MSEWMILPEDVATKVVSAALAEDSPWGDLTSQALIPDSSVLKAHLVAREPGVLCGADIFRLAMTLTDANIVTEQAKSDGAEILSGDVLAVVHGSARAVLQAERVALNLLQRLSGIATMTSYYVKAAAGTKARIVDTRKTTPGLRALERYAVRCGGGHNHRFSLSDAVMVKDNHFAVLKANDPSEVTEALRQMRSRLPHTIHIEVEVDRVDQIEPVIAAGVDTILFDNFTDEQLREGVARVAGRALVEASGGVTLARIRDIASTGVDLISVGALTHSVRSLDLGLDIRS